MLVMERSEGQRNLDQKETGLEQGLAACVEPWSMVIKGVDALSQSKAGMKRVGRPGGPSSGPCQHGVDAKAFTGRGAARRLREAQEAVDNIRHDMQEIAAATNAVECKTFYLCVHRRDATQQHSLRWRATGASASHLNLCEMPGLFDQCPFDAAQWYRKAHALALDLNAREIKARAELREAKRCAALDSTFDASFKQI
jgi:hypothetical protein